MLKFKLMNYVLFESQLSLMYFLILVNADVYVIYKIFKLYVVLIIIKQFFLFESIQ